MTPKLLIRRATRIAARPGHRFAFDYEAKREADIYESLLDLTVTTEHEITDLKPKDRIDIRSFIWVIGEYTESDVKEVHAKLQPIGEAG